MYAYLSRAEYFEKMVFFYYYTARFQMKKKFHREELSVLMVTDKGRYCFHVTLIEKQSNDKGKSFYEDNEHITENCHHNILL